MKFLLTAEYNAAGAAGAIKDGGTGRQAAVEALVASVGGSLDACYFTSTGTGVVLIVSGPDQASITAALFTVQSSGAISSVASTPLLTAAEVDAAMKLSPVYTPPGA